MRTPVAVIGCYRSLAGALWRAGPGWATAGAGAAVCAGLAPGVMMLASGALIGSLAAAVRDGLGSAAGHRVLVAVVVFGAASFGYVVAQGVVRQAVPALTSAYVVDVEGRLAAAVLAPDRVEHLDDAGVAHRVGAATEASRENMHLQAVESLLQVLEFRVQGLVAAGLLLGLGWWVPVVLAGGWVVFTRAFGRWRDTALDQLLETTGTPRRRAEYLRRLVMERPAAKELRIFGAASWVLDTYARVWLSAMEQVWRNRRRSLDLMVGAVVVLAISHGLGFGVLGYDAYHGYVSTGQVAVFAQAILATSMLGVTNQSTWYVSRAARTVAQIEALADELGPIPTPEPSTRMVAPRRGTPAMVELDGVRFGYPGGSTAVLDGVDLQIPAGQSVAIVGENGAGKSTLIKLLAGLYTPQQGCIRIDGLTVGDGDLAPLRSRIAVIVQSFVHYQLPLRDNVGFGDQAADDNAIRRALHAAGAGALADRGMDTVLSPAYDGGTDLSGGQWQRIALARALLALERGAGLLILDEPTSALDVRAEAALFDTVRHAARGMTTIVVSHRFSTVRRVDRILVLADGRIVEDGSHDKLIAADGRYAHMFSLQAQPFADTRARGDA